MSTSTPGPWFWMVNLKSRQVTLESTQSMHPTVMSFRRWGMGGAQPMFNCRNMVPASELVEIIPGHEHHAAWAQTIDHPDANLIIAAPDLLAACHAARNAILIWRDSIKEKDGEAVADRQAGSYLRQIVAAISKAEGGEK